ncbi:hypothetical protein CD006_26625 [Enterobacter sp. 10-1]|uniref:TraY domain-containing protein n=1 Tax=Raoultella sp. 10-1 TaxID=2683201 RepID=UPI000BA48AED|nr:MULTISPECIES: TraY domain-containing protein [Enterobacteriaceae]MVT06108.1 TraY domain-containing protein [Raoultella sp. 10-1]PAC07367.1 hypothetical protein CD006_26625 [Enterobacter sp. 10-1]
MTKPASISSGAPQTRRVKVILTAEASELLSAAAKKGKRSRQVEAMLRLHDSLKNIPEIQVCYWESNK